MKSNMNLSFVDPLTYDIFNSPPSITNNDRRLLNEFNRLMDTPNGLAGWTTGNTVSTINTINNLLIESKASERLVLSSGNNVSGAIIGSSYIGSAATSKTTVFINPSNRLYGIGFYTGFGGSTSTFDNWTINSDLVVGGSLGGAAKVMLGGGGWGVVLTTTGKLTTHGAGTAFQTGKGATTATTTYSDIASGSTFSDILAGYDYGYAIKSDGTLWSWGNNVGYATGRNTNTGSTQTPGQVGTDTNWTGAKMYTSYITGSLGRGTIIQKTDGTWWGIGTSSATYNYGLTWSYAVPTQLTTWPSKLVSYIRGDCFKTVFVFQDGTLYVLGRGEGYLLGNGSTSLVTVPTQVGSATNWVDCITIPNGGSNTTNPIMPLASTGNGDLALYSSARTLSLPIGIYNRLPSSGQTGLVDTGIRLPLTTRMFESGSAFTTGPVQGMFHY